MSDYLNINDPYNNFLERAVSEFGLQTNSGITDASGSTINTGGSAVSDPSQIDPQTILGQNITDLIIDQTIQSRGYQPKKLGFFLDAGTGYAEFTNVFVVGNFTAAGGTIGGFTVGSDYIRDTANSMGLAATVTGGDDVRFWAGDTFANRATAPFRVTESGAVTGSNITITGGSVSASILNGIISLNNTNLAAQDWTQTCSFTVTNATTVAWGAGTFSASSGTNYSISASDTGVMAAKTYVYLDINVSTTAYQITTTATTAIGSGKILIAIAQNATTEAKFMVLNNNSYNIDAANIVAGSITSNKIAAGAILATNISVSNLAAISADLGSITAGNITLDTSGYIQGGQTAYNTGIGFWLGYTTGSYKFSIGDPAGDYLRWDGTNLTLSGSASLVGTLPWSAITDDGGRPASNATVGADWNSNLSNIPTTLDSQSTTGLYLSSSYVGFWKSDSLGSSTSSFNIAVQSGSTYRYTYNGSGTNPNITTYIRVGSQVVANAQNFNAFNNGTFTVTGVGTNYFEVTNVNGVSESNKTIGTGSLKANNWNAYIDNSGNFFFRGDADSSIDWNISSASTLTVKGKIVTNSGSSLDGQYITSASIVGTSIASATITASNIASATITSSQIASATITAGNIANGTITTAQISASAAITGGQIASATLTGGNIASTTITAANIVNLTITAAQIANLTITSGKVNTALMSYSHNIAFSVSSSTKVSWASGTLTTSDGTAYSISAGDTGTMAAQTYVYLDTAISTTVLQTTTTFSTATGDGRMLIATAKNNTTEAIFQVFNGIGGMNLAGGNIVANSITANEIAAATITGSLIAATTITASNIVASTITADKMNISQLSAVAADLGAITAGTIVLNSSGYVRSGQTDFNTGTGFFLGLSGGITKFSIGDSTSRYLTWDGSTLTVKGVNNATFYQFTAGESISQYDAVYVKQVDGKVYRTVASSSGETIENFVGIAAEAKSSGQVVLVQTDGFVSGFSAVSSKYLMPDLTIDTSQTSWSTFLDHKTVGEKYGGTFTTGSDNTYVPIIGLGLKYTGAGTTVDASYTLDIYATSGGVPTGSALASTSTFLWNISGSTSRTTVYFKIPNYNFTASTKYAVVITRTGSADAGDYLSLFYNSVGSGGNGVKYVGGIWSADSTKDYIVYVYKGNYGIVGEAAYLGDTAGAIVSSAGTYERVIGTFLSTTSLLLNTQFKQRYYSAKTKTFASQNSSDTASPAIYGVGNKSYTVSENGLPIVRQTSIALNQGYASSLYYFWTFQITGGIEVIDGIGSSGSATLVQNWNWQPFQDNQTMTIKFHWTHAAGGGSTPTVTNSSVIGDVENQFAVNSYAQ